jgi:hypothetical protein
MSEEAVPAAARVAARLKFILLSQVNLIHTPLVAVEAPSRGQAASAHLQVMQGAIRHFLVVALAL